LETVCKICFVFNFILHTAYTVDARAPIRILPSLSFIDMIYFMTDTKETPASVQGVGVDFYIYKDFASPQSYKSVRNRTERFRCVFDSTDGYGV
jgi:hypothetical protein